MEIVIGIIIGLAIGFFVGKLMEAKSAGEEKTQLVAKAQVLAANIEQIKLHHASEVQSMKSQMENERLYAAKLRAESDQQWSQKLESLKQEMQRMTIEQQKVAAEQLAAKQSALQENNRLQLDYGFLYSEDKPFIQKSDDRIYYEGKFGYKATNTLNYSAQFSFKSQFTNSYNYPVPSRPDGADDTWEPGKSDWMAKRQHKSGFMSPAYTNVALGIDWVPTKWLTVNLAPLTGGFVVVSDESLRKSYGMNRKSDYKDEDKYPDAEGYYFRPARFEFGAQLKIDGKLQINDNFKYTSQLVLFSDYLDKPQNLRVNWDNRFDWKIAKYFSLTVTTNLIYDDKVMVKTEKIMKNHPDGKRMVQFKESLAFGFSYTIASRKR